MKLARVRHRVMAALLDFAIVVGFLALITVGKIPFLVSMIKGAEHVVTTKFVVDTFRYGILYSFFLILYYIIIPLFTKGQTIGKKIFKLQVVREDNEQLDSKTLFYREGVGRILIIFASLGLTSLVSVIIMALREDKKGLSDILAKTKVIDLYESEEE